MLTNIKLTDILYAYFGAVAALAAIYIPWALYTSWVYS